MTPGPVSMPLDRTEPEQLVVVEDLVKHFQLGRGKRVHSVDGVALTVRRGEVLGLVGESGCGKSTLARAILRAVQIDSGRVVFDGRDVSHAQGKELKALRRSMQLVFQDPYGALDPRMRLRTSLGAPLVHHGVKNKQDRRDRMLAMLERVGLDETILERRPHECSGGQLQRVVIARALLLEPQFLVCDEPTSSLDASIRAQILNLLVELKDELGLTLFLISHDLRVVRYLCDRVAVMYLGEIVEVATRDDLFLRPAHPYTKALIAAALAEEACAEQTAAQLEGEPSSPIDPPAGCRFHPRCPIGRDRDLCHTLSPADSPVGDEHLVRCHFWPEATST